MAETKTVKKATYICGIRSLRVKKIGKRYLSGFVIKLSRRRFKDVFYKSAEFLTSTYGIVYNDYLDLCVHETAGNLKFLIKRF